MGTFDRLKLLNSLHVTLLVHPGSVLNDEYNPVIVMSLFLTTDFTYDHESEQNVGRF